MYKLFGSVDKDIMLGIAQRLFYCVRKYTPHGVYTWPGGLGGHTWQVRAGQTEH